MSGPGFRASLADLMPGCFAAEDAGLMVSGVCSDSRQVAPGDLFFALDGYARRGSEFATDAIDAGAVAVASNDPAIEGMDLPVPHYIDRNIAQQTSVIAGRFFQSPSEKMDVIGITGTNGKTSCCYWLAWLLAESGYQVGQIGTLGAGRLDRSVTGELSKQLTATGFTTPDAVQTQRILSECCESGAELVVMEVSSHGLDQGRVEAVQFDSAVFTNLSQDHLDYHENMQAYLEAKLQLFLRPELKRAIVNLDDDVSEQVIASLKDGVELLSYSLSSTRADIYFSDIRPARGGYQLSIGGKWGAADLFVPVFGQYNLSNILAVVAVALSKGLSFERLVELVHRLPGVPGRMQPARPSGSAPTQQLPTVVIDYAHTPEGVRVVLEALRSQVPGRLIVVLGCGGERDQAKRPLMAAIASELADVQVFTSDNPRGESSKKILDDMMAGVDSVHLGRVSIVEDRREAIEQALLMASKQDLVAVLGKGHETFQEVAGVRMPFSDLDVSQELLTARAQSEATVGGASS